MRQGIHALADCRVSGRTNEFFSPLSEDFRYETGNSFPGKECRLSGRTDRLKAEVDTTKGTAPCP